LFQLYLDLSELPELFDPYLLWSARRPAIAWFRREDHFGDPATPLDDCVRDEVQRQTGSRPDGPIRLLTNLRYFGYVINPVSYFYCFSADSNRLQTVLAEVHNTPWGERHCYVLPSPVNSATGAVQTMWNDKDFHVSPFMQMAMRYRWNVTEPGERLAIHIENHATAPGELSDQTDDPVESAFAKKSRQPFDVTLSMQRTAISGRSLRNALLRHPCMTASVAAGIYWQAMRLWWKNVPFVPHPGARGNQTRRPDTAGVS
jgi:DUF1365 family protein